MTVPVRDWEESVATEGTPAKNAWYAVRVFPPLLSPSRLDLLAGHSLADAFKKYVLQDPELIAALEWHGGPFEELCRFEGHLPVEVTRYADFEGFQTSVLSFWDNPNLSLEKPNLSRRQKRLARSSGTAGAAS
jgi:hypothetical protein